MVVLTESNFGFGRSLSSGFRNENLWGKEGSLAANFAEAMDASLPKAIIPNIAIFSKVLAGAVAQLHACSWREKKTWFFREIWCWLKLKQLIRKFLALMPKGAFRQAALLSASELYLVAEAMRYLPAQYHTQCIYLDLALNKPNLDHNMRALILCAQTKLNYRRNDRACEGTAKLKTALKLRDAGCLDSGARIEVCRTESRVWAYVGQLDQATDALNRAWQLAISSDNVDQLFMIAAESRRSKIPLKK